MNLEHIQQLPHHVTVTIPEEYRDIFDHMNFQYYLKIFNDGVFDMFDGVGMTESYFLDNQVAMYAVDQRLNFKSEVKINDTVSIYSRLIARSSKSLHFMQFMVNDTQHKVAATLEGLGFHVSQETKRSAPFLDNIVAEIDARLAEDHALEWDVLLSQAIQVSKK